MIGPAVSLLTHVWHYTLARGVYEDLVRPLLRGHLAILVGLALLAWAGFAAGRRYGRRR